MMPESVTDLPVINVDWFDAVFPKRDIRNTLGEWVAKHGKTQFRLAETEKYPHVTFFLNAIDILADQGAEGAVFGCTELGLLLDEDDAVIPGFNTTRIHAVATVEAALD